MDSPELVAVSCPECRCVPVEVLKKLRSGRRFLWCPQCRAIWAVDTWVLNRPASLTEQAPKVIAFGPSSGRRPF
jgi:Zn-finger nucleic acid-binding protein